MTTYEITEKWLRHPCLVEQLLARVQSCQLPMSETKEHTIHYFPFLKTIQCADVKEGVSS